MCFGLFSLVFVLGALSAGLTEAQDTKFPSKPIEVLVPVAPGGIVDTGARVFGEYLSQELSTPIIVKNQVGAGGLVGTLAFLKTKPDGYTILAATGSNIIFNVLLAKTPPFDPWKDLLPICHLAYSPLAVVVPKASPFGSFDEIIRFGKTNPGKLKAGITNLGGETHMTLMSIMKDTNIEGKVIPYSGLGDQITALLGGHVDWACVSFTAALRYANSGDIRVLLLTRAAPQFPGVPVAAAKGLRTSIDFWIGFFTLPQTPKVAYDRLVSASDVLSKNPNLIKKLTDIGFNIDYKNRPEFSRFLETQWNDTSRIIKETGIKME
jgi:tripartite-type tricarboxylate transporter receptor subunit TctC